jgi:N-acetylmuramoyl-L-alanine amidase
MPKKHTIREGDSITSLGERFGLFEETIWLHPDNAALRELRPNKNILALGDVVVIPDKEVNVMSCGSDTKHSFRRKGVPALFKVQLFHIDTPRAEQSYRLDLDGQLRDGVTDSDGVLEESVPSSTKKAILIIGPDAEKLEFNFGVLEPLDETKGVAQRLSNIGLYKGKFDVPADYPELVDAISKFQAQQELDITSKIDDMTLEKLNAVHDIQ